MLNPELYLRSDFFQNPQNRSVREGFAEGLRQAGEENENVIALTADLKESVRMDLFAEKFPKRFFDIGVAEQNLVTISAGLAMMGKIPFAGSYAAFSPGRNWEQIRTTICYNDANVKIIGSHAGLATGPDGATHQMLEDIALMRTLPNMNVFSPCDAEEAKRVTLALARFTKPAYMRIAREKSFEITTPETPFNLGKIETFWMSERPECAIFATGMALSPALFAAKILEEEGIRVVVLNVHTLKPFDEKGALTIIKKTKAFVSVEDHQIAGGLGSILAEMSAKNFPAPQEFVGVSDSFGESGTAGELYALHGVTAEAIAKAVQKAIERKNSEFKVKSQKIKV